MKKLVGILFLVVLPALGASPIPGTQGLNCFEILRVPDGGSAAAANLARHDLICAVDGFRFGVEHQKDLKEEWESSVFVVNYMHRMGVVTLEVYRDGVAHNTTLDGMFDARIVSVFLQIGPTHGRANRMGIQDGDVILGINEIGCPHLIATPMSAETDLDVMIRRDRGAPFSLHDFR